MDDGIKESDKCVKYLICKCGKNCCDKCSSEYNEKKNIDTKIIPVQIVKKENMHQHGHCRQKIKRFSKRIWLHLEGGIWGLSEGLASGALTGTQTAGKGGWIVGGMTQTAGAIFGTIGGSLSGFICGLMTDKYTMMTVFEDYRKRFGSTTVQGLSGQTDVTEKALENKYRLKEKENL